MIRQGLPAGASGLATGSRAILIKWRDIGNTADLPVNLKLLNIIWDVPTSPF
jgi:hypothetical protein